MQTQQVIALAASQIRTAILQSQERAGLRGFGARNLKNMRSFYEAWSDLDSNSAVMTAELEKSCANEHNTIRQLQLTNYPDFPLLRAEWTSEMEADRISIAQVPPKYRPNQPTRPDQMYRLTDAAKEWKGK